MHEQIKFDQILFDGLKLNQVSILLQCKLWLNSVQGEIWTRLAMIGALFVLLCVL